MMSTPGTAPFTAKVLGDGPDADFSELLPAATRVDYDKMVVPFTSDEVLAFLSRDLSVYRLNTIYQQLWMAGRPMPPRHLCYQTVLSRDVIVSEEMELHLVWKAKRIYIKPLPRYLLAMGFWNRYILSSSPDDSHSPTQRAMVASCARGFLLSYCALVVYESDLRLAKDIGLLPREIEWKQWRLWVAQVIHNCPYKSVDKRFWYGELRLSRLNMIYRWRKGFFLHGYTHVGAPSDYTEFLSENFSALVVGLGFFVVILTAMQVGLATEHLQESLSFQAASWGFTVFSIVASLAASVVIFVTFVAAFAVNWVRAKDYEKRRWAIMDVHGSGSPL